MGQTASYLIAGIPAQQGIPFTAEQLTAIQVRIDIDRSLGRPTAYPAWVVQQAAQQRAGQPLDSPAGQAAAPVANTPQSSGAQTQQAQAARDDRANTQNPPGPPLIQNANGRVGQNQTQQPTNARTSTNTADVGTNAPTRTGTNTQSTPAITAQPVQTPRNTPSVGATAASWVTNPVNALTNAVIGAFSGGDDAYTSALRSRINSFVAANTVVTPQSNLLGQYYSYTYNISL
jgi:hypothetical protein